MSTTLKNKRGLLNALKAFSFLLLCVSISGCHISSDKNPTETNVIATAMNSYSSSIHSITLPFKDACTDTLAVQKTAIPDSLAKFKKYGQVVGKINETKKYVAILYSVSGDVQLPVLRTFDLNGELISTKKLFIGNCCGENEDCSGLSTAEITKNLHIILKDSTQTFVRDKNKADKKSNIQLKTKRVEFEIDTTGKIQEVHTGVNNPS